MGTSYSHIIQIAPKAFCRDQRTASPATLWLAIPHKVLNGSSGVNNNARVIFQTVTGTKQYPSLTGWELKYSYSHTTSQKPLPEVYKIYICSQLVISPPPTSSCKVSSTGTWMQSCFVKSRTAIPSSYMHFTNPSITGVFKAGSYATSAGLGLPKHITKDKIPLFHLWGMVCVFPTDALP